jgi:hypothetical protein
MMPRISHCFCVSDFLLVTLLSEIMIFVFSFLFLDNTSVVHSNYSSALTENHPTYRRQGFNSDSRYYFEAIKINVNTTGYYAFRSMSTMDTYGYLYNNSFDPFFPDVNLLYSDDSEGGNSQFLVSAVLQTMTDYFVVVTTTSPLVIGSFSILAIGPDSVSFSPINMTGKPRNYL